MQRLVALALCLVAATSCTAATATLTVLESSEEAKVLHSSKCQMLTSQEVSSLPTGFERHNVCFYGTLYSDSEYTVVFPSDRSSKSTQWDVTVMLPALSDPNKNLQKFDGKRVLLIGDLKYDQDCCAGALKPNEQRICTPAERPIYLSNGTLVFAE
jgi:hypothetical protein